MKENALRNARVILLHLPWWALLGWFSSTALAMLYAVRVLAGAAAVSVPLSPWLLAFFLFLALAIVKRQGELRTLRGSGRSASGGRAYLAEDVPVMAALGAASGFASVVILTLYIQSPETGERSMPARSSCG